MIVCRKHHVYCLHDCVETSLSDCSTLYWKQQNIYPWYLKIYNSAVRQYFQMKFCAYFAEYFRIKHTKFTQDAFRFHISVVHCVGFTFSGHGVVALGPLAIGQHCTTLRHYFSLLPLISVSICIMMMHVMMLGHNWGSPHDPVGSSCAPPTEKGGKFVMYWASVSGVEPHNQVCSI